MRKISKVSILVSDFASAGLLRAYLLGKALKSLGYEVQLVGFLFGKSFYREIPTADFSIFYLPGDTYPQIFRKVPQLLRHIEGDIIYAIKPLASSFGIALLKKINSHIPVILDIDDWEMSWHGGDNWRYQPTAKELVRDIFKKHGALRYPNHPLYLKWMEKLLPQADAITVHTSFLQQRFGGVSVPNGKDTDLFDPSKYDAEASRQRYGLSAYRILMFPGAPRPYKGLEDILAAIATINQPDLKLVIVGGSPYDDYDQQLQAKWGNWLIKLPKYPAHEMPEIVAAAHIIVVPQRDTKETRAQFPLKLTDGMAMAKPILTTQVGDIPDILGDTGYLVESGSSTQMAEKIQWIFANLESAQKQGEKARIRCIEKYSIQAMAHNLQSVIHQVSAAPR
ncbi:glycosyltransferase family 4 protein [Calothrix sp. 336/3]|uniref:glycosyltransferase family 4 protein n=1 Tax=Calothrix sp. 336/3 TaxID=1337936 RepID=UPI0004E3CD78|nr:glycosyltransferase family 4 protein [Calothrix sp. 336/3]AKG21017.1 glycosyl transferase group 1 [Calothrix sp. 336/3]